IVVREMEMRFECTKGLNEALLEGFTGTLYSKFAKIQHVCSVENLGTMSLELVNFSRNRFEEFPRQFLQLLKGIPLEIENLTSLELLYLGGNNITSIPPELANLPKLSYLVLCDNRIQSIPPQRAQLHSLHSLSLHNNLLTYVPREIVNLVHLQKLSLRGNPLVVWFVKDLTYDPPSLLELAGRTVKFRNIPYFAEDLPDNLITYLDLASNALYCRHYD
uniref:Leucine rich repeat containing 58 n=1 Tax=Erpetoichthys calabaricus TaxID=27687 RepID=A0A8C4TD77_ERPCA